MAKIDIHRRFCGPPNSGNGGYVCGVIAKDIHGPATAVLTARPPLEVRLNLRCEDGIMQLTDAEEAPIGRAVAADRSVLPAPPEAPSMRAARAAGARYEGFQKPFHPTCFTCATDRAAG